MVNPGCTVAHLVKLAVTLLSMKYMQTLQSHHEWVMRSFQIFLIHSILGILRFGGPGFTSTTVVAKRFRRFYSWYSEVIEIVPFALITNDILYCYRVHNIARLVLLTLSVLPILYDLTIKSKENSFEKLQYLTNVFTALQLTVLTFVCLRHGNYNVISLSMSYAFIRYFAEECCDRYDVPYTDLTQYCLSFVQIFTVVTVRDL